MIVDGAKSVKIFRESVAVKAKVVTIGGFSSHADQNDLVAWAGNFESKPQVFVVHGEPQASDTLAGLLHDKYGFVTHVPRWKERLILKPKESTFEKPSEEELPEDVKTDILNNIVDLEKEIKALRKRIQSVAGEEGFSGDEVDRLKYVQEELKSLLGE